ncbi:hypothetical protein MNBD_ALPHA03-2117, partial [hydrothermal vent metagenome]
VILAPKKSVSEENDPMLEPFLRLLSNDIAKHPEKLRPVSVGLFNQINDLTADVDIDLDEALPHE